jgi:hypothetical protein
MVAQANTVQPQHCTVLPPSGCTHTLPQLPQFSTLCAMQA